MHVCTNVCTQYNYDFFFQVVINTERVLKHAVQEKLAVTVCINKVCIRIRMRDIIMYT